MKYFVLCFLWLSSYLVADRYCFELSEQATDIDGNKQIKGHFSYTITSDIEIVRTEFPTSPALPKDSKIHDESTIDWSFQFKSFSFEHEKTGEISSFDPDTLQKFQSIDRKIKGRNEIVHLSDSGLIAHNVEEQKLQGKGWQDYEANLKKSIDEGKLEWTDAYAVVSLIGAMPVCFAIDEIVSVGDVIDLPFANPLSENHFSSSDRLTTKMIVTERDGNYLTLESHNTRKAGSGKDGYDNVISGPKDKSFIQEYSRMEYDLDKQMPVKITQNRFVKIIASPEFTQVQQSKFVIYLKNRNN